MRKIETFEISEHQQGHQIMATFLMTARDAICGERTQAAVFDCLGVIKQNSLFHMANQDGPLARSMNEQMLPEQPNVLIQGKVTMMKDGKQLPYAWMEEKGGVIVPRPENPIQRLVWEDESGKLIFAKRVTHIGKDYMGQGARDSRDFVKDRLFGAINIWGKGQQEVMTI